MAHVRDEAFHVLVRDKGILLVAPPNHHISVIERHLVETLRRRSERNILHRENRSSREVRRDGFAEKLLSIGALLLRLLFIPHQRANRARSGAVQGRCRHEQHEGENGKKQAGLSGESGLH